MFGLDELLCRKFCSQPPIPGSVSTQQDSNGTCGMKCNLPSSQIHAIALLHISYLCTAALN